MMTIPLTPSASCSSPSTAGSAMVADLNKDLPSTPTKNPIAKLFTPSPGKGKKPSTIIVRIPTPTSPTLAAGKNSVRKMVTVEDKRGKEESPETSSLNPRSSSFQPKPRLSTTDFMSKMQAVSLSGAGPSTPPLEYSADAEQEEHLTPKKKKDETQLRTPPRSTQSQVASYTPALSYTPYTPSTSQSIKMPVTPSTPTYFGCKTDGDEKHSQKENQMQMAFASKAELPEEIGRYLVIQQVPRDTTENEIRNLIQSIGNFKAIIIKHIKTKGLVMVAFYDTREALKLYNTLHASSVRLRKDGPMLQLHCMKTEQAVIQSSIGHSVGWEKVWEDSEAVIKIEISGGVGVSREVIEKTLSIFGEVQRLDPVGHDGRCFIAEFYDTRHAAEAIRSLHNQKAGQALILVSYLEVISSNRNIPPPPSKYTLGSSAYIPGRLGQGGSSTRSQAESMSSSDIFGYTTSTDTSASSPLNTPRTSTFGRVRSDQDGFNNRKPSSLYSSASQSRHASGYSTPHSWDRGSAVGSQYETPARILALSRRLHEPGTVEGLMSNADIHARARQGQGLGGHWHSNDRKAIPAQNRVFEERILSGLDNRTTVMIKDVPNKLSRQELINILEEVVPGEFDFVYLRFDFKNCCNVGYAFVNFCSVKALYEFIRAKVGKKWNMFSSEKVLQVSYADIQGKAALINKFKNSAVMGVIEDWRPQIFYSSGRMKGKPEPFPESDNLAVRQRSAAAQLAGFSSSSSYSYGYDEQYYDYSSPHGSTVGI